MLLPALFRVWPSSCQGLITSNFPHAGDPSASTTPLLLPPRDMAIGTPLS